MRHVSSFAAVVASALAFAGVASARTVALDLRAASAPTRGRAALQAPAPSADGVLRRTRLGAGATGVGAVSTGDEISCTLFDDVSMTLSLRERVDCPLGGEAFLAATSDGARNAVVLRTPDGLSLDVRDADSGRVYKVASSSAGVVSLPENTEGYRRSGSSPTHSGEVRNSQAQWMASRLK